MLVLSLSPVKLYKGSLTALLPTDDTEPGPADELLGVGGDLAAVHPRQLLSDAAQTHHRHALVALHPRHVRPHHAGKIFLSRIQKYLLCRCHLSGRRCARVQWWGRCTSQGAGAASRYHLMSSSDHWRTTPQVLGHFHPVNRVFGWSFAINYPLRKKVKYTLEKDFYIL